MPILGVIWSNKERSSLVKTILIYKVHEGHSAILYPHLNSSNVIQNLSPQGQS